MCGEPKPSPDLADADLSHAVGVTNGGMHLRTFADLSTAHLTEELAQWLEAECERRSLGVATEGMPSIWNLGTGFFIWIPDPEFEHPDFDRVVDPVLQRILQYARQAGADYVLLDRDADTCDVLPVFDW